MNKPLQRAVSTAAVLAAGLAGALAHSPTASAAPAASSASQSPSAAPVKTTRFGMKSNVYGTKVLVGGVELKNLKEAQAEVHCTTVAGREVVEGATASTDLLPIPGDLIHVSPSTSRSLTYRNAKLGVTGVKGINTIADISIGGELADGVATPVLKIEGLQSIADSFYDAKAEGGKGAFGSTQSFSFQGMSIEMPEDSAIPPELADLLDILSEVTAPIAEIVNQVIALLGSVGEVEIPGLGSLGLGKTSSHSSATHAASEAYALKIEVDPSAESNDSVTVLQLGRAHTRIAKPITSGIFRSEIQGLDLLAGSDLLHMGGIGTQTIPCEGTGGKVMTKTIPSASVLGGTLVNLTGLQYRWMGEQLPRGEARSMVQSRLGSLEIPAVGLVIEGISSKINLRKVRSQKRVQRTITTTLGKITVDGEELALPKFGEEIVFGDGNVIKYGRVRRQHFTGAGLSAISVTLPGFDSIIDVGLAAARISDS